ncbi:hypothetical protein Mapa_008257 [Marchantia paleacea]|nr:hypothetical protein Mapa_008257 [Marchantia paleacea]
MQRVEMKMGQILSLQHELQSTLIAFMSSVDRSIGYSESLQQARTPKRPHITVDDVGSLSRITAAVRFGRAVRLHLMCESVTGIHIVKDQEGLELRLDQENRGWLGNISEISCKFVYYVVKAGLHVTLGLGQALPEFGNLETAVPLSAASIALESISRDDCVALTKGEESMTLNEAWLQMRQALAPQLENNYSKIFKLYQMKYVSEEDQCLVILSTLLSEGRVSESGVRWPQGWHNRRCAPGRFAGIHIKTELYAYARKKQPVREITLFAIHRWILIGR